MSLFNDNYKKTKNLILIAVLLLTVGFGVLGAGERAWGDDIPDVIDLTPEEMTNVYPSDIDPLLDLTIKNAQKAEETYLPLKDGIEPPEPSSAKDTIQDILGSMVAWVLYYIAVGIGWILMLVMQVMIAISVFNKFVSQPMVTQGWVIVRDICNNFFIIFLMILAVQVTLNIKANEWRSKLTNILLYAVLINFSLTLVGIAIDASQILMLTFASPLANQLSSNIILAAIGLPQLYNMGDVTTLKNTGVEWLDIIAALLFAIIVSIVALIVVVCITAILIWRIVMLIFLCILSPLPFLSRAGGFSVLKSLESEYVGKLTNMLVVGPAMMFFLYLSFMMMAAMVNGTPGQGLDTVEVDVNVDDKAPVGMKSTGDIGSTDSLNRTTKLSGMATTEGLFKFMIVIGFLWGSLMMGRKFGDAASGIAGKGMNMISSGAKKFSGFNLASKAASATPGFIGKKIGQKAGTVGLGLATGATRLVGKGSEKVFGGTSGLTKLANVGTQWRADVLEKRRDAKRDKRAKFMDKIGFGSEKAKSAWGEFTNTDLAKGTKLAATGALSLGTNIAAGAGMVALTGGAGAIPALAALAGGYLGGGGRLLEIGLGKLGKNRKEKRETAQKDVDRQRNIISEVDRNSQEEKQRKIKERIDSLSAPLRTVYNEGNQAKREMEQIESVKVENGKIDTRSLPQDFITSLLLSGRYSQVGNKIDINAEELEREKSTFRTSVQWQGRDTRSGQSDRIVNNISNTAETERQTEVGTELTRRTGNNIPDEERISQPEITRWREEGIAKTQLDNSLNSIKTQLNNNIAGIARTIPELERQAQIKEFRGNAQERIREANETYNQAVQTAQPPAIKPGIVDSALKDYEPYVHPNWVSQAVAKKANIEAQKVKDVMSVIELGSNDMFDNDRTFSPGKFYSGSGQTLEQFKIFDALTSSSKGIEQMVRVLNTLPQKLDKGQSKTVEELKKGLAAYSKGGGDTTKLSAVINVLNDKVILDSNGAPKERKTVKEMEADVKEKK